MYGQINDFHIYPSKKVKFGMFLFISFMVFHP